MTVAAEKVFTVEGVRIPDSRLAREITELVRDTESTLLFHHSSRVYYWGALAGSRRGLKFDRELLYAGAMFHDMGLTPAHSSAHERFEVDGANAARDFLRGHGIGQDDIDTVWTAIALHTTPGIPQHMHPIIALVTAGVEMDVLGLSYTEYSGEEREAVVHAYPRTRHFKEDIIQAFYDGIKHKPDTTFGNVKADVLADKAPAFRRGNFCGVNARIGLEGLTRRRFRTAWDADAKAILGTGREGPCAPVSNGGGTMTEPTDIDEDIAATSRRRFLRDGGALMGGAVVAGVLSGSEALGASEGADNLPPNVPEWMKTPGDPMGSQPYGMPSPFEKGVVKNIPKDLSQYLSASGRTPLQDLDGIITPNGLFYERHHGGVPTIDPAQHRLMLHGLVDKPLIFTMDDIRRFPSETRIHFLECSGNPGYKKPYGKTASDLVGLLSCAEWTGVSLKRVLQEAGLQAGAKWVVAEGANSAALTRSIPIEKCLDDAMLVYSQNGERLRPQQGYPLRLLLPGFEGNMSVKWLRRLRVAAEPTYSREETSKYTDLMPGGSAREFTFYMEAKSIITRPSGGQRLSAPGFHEISGIAWSGHGKIARVDVSVDEGKSWQEAQLQEPVLTRALTRFRLPWHWDGRPAVIQSRATDETGYVQPTLSELLAVRGENYFYHNNAIWPWRIAAGGEVTNANA